MRQISAERASSAALNVILGFIIRTYKKVGFGRLRYALNPEPVEASQEAGLRQSWGGLGP